MKKRIILTIALLLVYTVFIAGCTSNTPSSTPSAVASRTTSSTPSPIPTTQSQLSTIDPSQMALTLSEVPAGFILKEGTPLTFSDASQTSLANGWEKGYNAEFDRSIPVAGSIIPDIEVIQQYISVYPINNVNQVITQGGTKVLQSANATFKVEQLSDPKIGDFSQAYKLNYNLKNEQISGFIIYFAKKDVVESFIMQGTSADYSTLDNLANIAEAKVK